MQSIRFISLDGRKWNRDTGNRSPIGQPAYSLGFFVCQSFQLIVNLFGGCIHEPEAMFFRGGHSSRKMNGIQNPTKTQLNKLAQRRDTSPQMQRALSLSVLIVLAAVVSVVHSACVSEGNVRVGIFLQEPESEATGWFLVCLTLFLMFSRMFITSICVCMWKHSALHGAITDLDQEKCLQLC